MQLTPENPPKLQTLNVTSVQRPNTQLAALAQEHFVQAAITAVSLDGPLTLTDEYVRGNGTSHLTQVARGERGLWHYSFRMNPVTEEVLESSVVLAPTNETHFIN
jgi:hypothetical protein